MIGIYKITNLVNQKVYIGQSWNIEERWNKHKLNKNYSYKKGKNTKNHLYSAFQKYGIENFDYSVLVELQECCLTQFLLDYFECKYIKEFDSLNTKKGYNLKEGGSQGRLSASLKATVSKSLKKYYELNVSSNKGKKYTEEERKKMSERNKGKTYSNEYKKHMSEVLKGRIFTTEWKENISKSLKGKKGKRNYPIPIKVLIKTTKEILLFPSLRKASKFLNVRWSSLSNRLKKELEVEENNYLIMYAEGKSNE